MPAAKKAGGKTTPVDRFVILSPRFVQRASIGIAFAGAVVVYNITVFHRLIFLISKFPITISAPGCRTWKISFSLGVISTKAAQVSKARAMVSCNSFKVARSLSSDILFCR